MGFDSVWLELCEALWSLLHLGTVACVRLASMNRGGRVNRTRPALFHVPLPSSLQMAFSLLTLWDARVSMEPGMDTSAFDKLGTRVFLVNTKLYPFAQHRKSHAARPKLITFPHQTQSRSASSALQ